MCKRQKFFFNSKCIGNHIVLVILLGVTPYSVGDIAWCHSIVIPKGQSRRLHHPWKGPFRVVEFIGVSDHKIKTLKGRTTQLYIWTD